MVAADRFPFPFPEGVYRRETGNGEKQTPPKAVVQTQQPGRALRISSVSFLENSTSE